MLNFIKTVLEENVSEQEKYSQFIEVAEKEIEAEELAEVIKYIKEKQSIIIDLPNSLDICGT
jgi:anthranilate phosphoribosyltransferase